VSTVAAVEWTTLAGVVLGAGLALGAAVLTGWLERRHAKSVRVEERQEKRVQEAAEIIARLELLLSDSDPTRLGVNLDPNDPFGAYKPLEMEWRTTLRPQLAAYALAHPATDVRERGQALVSELWNSIISTGWHLRELSSRHGQGGQSGLDQYERAIRHHSESERLAREFMAAVRGD
jgi:hypothetical protein